MRLWFHYFIKWLNRFKKYPNARRNAWFSDKAVVPKSCIIGERVKLKHKIVLGENCFINDDVCMGGIITIGKGCRIETKVKITSCSTLGNGKLYAPNLSLYQKNAPVGGESDEQIVIGDFVLIGDSCVITKGVRIGTGAVLNPGSVVFDSIPDYGIVRGNPAVLIGFRNNRIESK